MKPGEIEDRIRKCTNRAMNIRYWELCHELTKAETLLLGMICTQGHDQDFVEVSALIECTGMLPSAVSRLMKGLEEKQLIERTISRGNRRNVLVRATEAGIMANDRNQRIIHDYWEKVLAGLPSKDVEEMLRIWEELLSSMETVLENSKKKE